MEKELELRTAPSQSHALAPTFYEFSIEYLNWHKFEYKSSHARIHQITHDHLIPHLNNTPLDEISPLQLELYKQLRAQYGAKTETINKELRTLNAIINKATEWQAINKNPINKLPTLKVTDSKPARFYTSAELDQIYQWAPYNWYIWRLMANTGLRRSELINLKWENIKDETIIVQSTEDARTKSGKWRPVPMSMGAKIALDRLEKNNPKKQGKIITITPPSLSRAFSKVLNRTTIQSPHGSLHSLRHSFCSHLVMKGIDLTTVQKLAGHSTINVTEKYAHLAPDHITKATQVLDL